MTTLRQEADARHRLHVGQRSSRPLSADYELVGIAGEEAFAALWGQPRNRERLPEGDGGIDFIVWLFVPGPGGDRRFTLDVKTARIPKHLFVEVGHVTCDLYVQASYDDATETATLIGWEWGRNVLKVAPRPIGNNGVINHAIPARDLRPMSELLARRSRSAGRD